MKGETELGDIAKDTITGFQGVVIGITKWLHGCRRITIQPQSLKDGKPLEAHGFDEPQVKIIKKAAFAETADTGGPKPEPLRRAEIRR